MRWFGEAQRQAEQEDSVIEAIRDQWVIVFAVVVLIVIAVYLFAARKR